MATNGDTRTPMRPKRMLVVARATTAPPMTPAAADEQHELARPYRDPRLLEPGEQRALGVDRVDELSGDADGVLDQLAVAVGDVADVDVLFAPGQVEDLGQLLLTFVDPGEHADGQERETAADEEARRTMRTSSPQTLLVGDLRLGGHPGRPAPGGVAFEAVRAARLADLKLAAGISMPCSAILSMNLGRRPVAPSWPVVVPSAPGVSSRLKMSCSRMMSPSMPCTSVSEVMTRRPSGMRVTWRIRWSAEAICSRMARTGRS